MNQRYTFLLILVVALPMTMHRAANAQVLPCCCVQAQTPTLACGCADDIFQDCATSCDFEFPGCVPRESLPILQCEASCVDLPVELVSFEAVAEEMSVLLTWETASEEINSGFDVEREIGSNVFEAIAFVPGAGTTNTPQSYLHRVEDLDPGTHRFRLRQIDFDGGSSYSETVEVALTVPGDFVLEPAYPNPFNPSTAVRFAVAVEQSVRVDLYDALGKSVLSVFEGTVEANSVQTVQVQGDGLATGMYVIRLEGQNFVATQQVLLVK